MGKKKYPYKIRKPHRKKKKGTKSKLRTLRNTLQAVEDIKPTPIKKTTTVVITDKISVKYIYEHLPEQHKEITSVRNVSLLYRRKNKFVSIARYDDHDGTDFHRHDKIRGKDVQIAISIDGGPKKWLSYAIDDFIKNYNKYITQYLQNSD